MNVSQINSRISEAYQAALVDAKHNCGRGCFRSRGRWLKAVNHRGDTVRGECDTWAWDGKAADLADVQRIFEGDTSIQAIYIEGGVDYAESVRDFSDGAYDPLVEEWEFKIFER
jgi:hypothetical protein